MQSWEALLSGAVVAERYQVVKPLARGGFGVVYVAEHVATERRVALKVLWPHVLADKRAREQFTLEARVGSRIKSENVVQVLDAGVDTLNDVTYLVMELLEGRDLAKLVDESGPPSPKDAIEYLRQTAAGLDKAHRHVDRAGRPAPIIHRDLKPENLFLTTREDGSPLVKILDFGIAKVLSQSTQMSGDVKGTPLYMAYEQAARGAIGPATDIWAFGLIAFFLLTGKNYWKSANSPEGSMTQLFGEVLSLPLSPPTLRATELGLRTPLTPAFDVWFSRCVHRDSSQRFQNVAEAMSALVKTGVAEPQPIAPVSLAVSAAAAVSSAAVGAVTNHELTETLVADVRDGRTPAGLNRTLPTPEHPSAQPAHPRRRRNLIVVATLCIAALAVGAGWWAKAGAPVAFTATELLSSADISAVPAASAPRGAAASPEPRPASPGSADSAEVASSARSPQAQPPQTKAPSSKPPNPKPLVKPPQPGARPARSNDDVYGDR